ncbi:Na/Pi cotransporter family protein [Aquabacter spiritensis]|uniref:Phosphate:Na+ symporter n=1 Tax=Aquabacter spiritensis TaxID=933073 RepID=A0A4R3LSI9_9HYPH|nr:Na/Pi cotransporter family protein [Aquabacter spiritensis]TCT01555.1 phosphate:Na+ symporter [Aquabacter spiritensis]
MTFSLTFINLAGAVAMLLWGTHMVQNAVQQAFGPRLRRVLGAALKDRVRAFFAGIGVTALLQSSTATGLMVAGFTSAGMVDLVPALAVMLGANVGTTLVVQLLSFNAAALAPALFLIGVVMVRRKGASLSKDLGPAVIGLGLMLLALHNLIEIFTPLEDTPSLRLLMGAISTQPVIAMLLAAFMTWVVHSSVAIVLLTMSLAAQGAVPPEAAIALVIGANLGSALNPVLEASSTEDPASRRMPMGNLLNRVIGAVVGLALIDPITALMLDVHIDLKRAVADFHTLFNLVLAVIFLPVLGQYARLLTRFFPDKAAAADPYRPLYLNPAATETPVVAIGNAAREALRLADLLDEMLRDVRAALERRTAEAIGKAHETQEAVERLNAAIKAYLLSIDRSALSARDEQRISEILAFTTNMEQAGDVIDNSMLSLAAKSLKRDAPAAEAGSALGGVFDRVETNLRTAAALFISDDPRAARLLAAEKAIFRTIETRATEAHMVRLREGANAEAETSTLHLEVVRDLKRINAHLVSGTAYPVLERGGEVLET